VVGIKILKNKLSQYVKFAAAGERVLVTDRNRVVAELVPPQGNAESVVDARLADAMRLGWLQAAVLPTGRIPARAPVAPYADLLRELDQDRGDR